MARTFEANVQQDNTFAMMQEQARKFFEPQLTALGLGKEQIEGATLEELEASLERVNDAITHPESFGTLRLKVSASGLIVASTESQIEIGILPILLERKRLILERIAILKGNQKIENLKETLKGAGDEEIRVEVDKQISELQAELKKWQEKAREAEQAQIKAQEAQQMEFSKLQAEIFERRSKVWLSFLQRESVATIVGAFLLVAITIAIIVANFMGVAVSQILSSAFLVILGYFFGQAVGKASAKSGDN